MPSIHNAFPSSYVRASDLGNRRITVTISHLKMEDVGEMASRNPCCTSRVAQRGWCSTRPMPTAWSRLPAQRITASGPGQDCTVRHQRLTQGQVGGLHPGCRGRSQQSEPDAARPVAHPATPPITDDDPSIRSEAVMPTPPQGYFNAAGSASPAQPRSSVGSRSPGALVHWAWKLEWKGRTTGKCGTGLRMPAPRPMR